MGGCCVSVNVAKTKTSEWSGLLLKVRVHWSEEEDRRRERPSSISISAVKCWSSRFHSHCRRCQRNWRLQQKPERKQENVLLLLLEAGGTFIYLFPLLLWNCCPFKSLSPLVSSVFSPSCLSCIFVFVSPGLLKWRFTAEMSQYASKQSWKEHQFHMKRLKIKQHSLYILITIINLHPFISLFWVNCWC